MSWPGKAMAYEAVKVNMQVGFFKNGNPKFQNFYKCAQCEREGNLTLYKQTETQADHILSVIDEDTGFQDWNEFIDRLFCDASGYQILCKKCHQKKSSKENKVRKKRKKT